MSDLLSELDESWKKRGFGIQFGKWSSCTQAWEEWARANADHLEVNLENFVVNVIAFVDDLYLVAKSLTEGQIMANELIEALAKVGL